MRIVAIVTANPRKAMRPAFPFAIGGGMTIGAHLPANDFDLFGGMVYGRIAMTRHTCHTFLLIGLRACSKPSRMTCEAGGITTLAKPRRLKSFIGIGKRMGAKLPCNRHIKVATLAIGGGQRCGCGQWGGRFLGMYQRKSRRHQRDTNRHKTHHNFRDHTTTYFHQNITEARHRAMPLQQWASLFF